MSLVVESAANLSAGFWKVVEFARQCCGRIDASCWSWKSSELLAAVACIHGTHIHTTVLPGGLVTFTCSINNCKDSFFAISSQHVTVMNIHSCMDAAIILYMCG